MEPRDAYGAYSRAWNAEDPGERGALLGRVWADDAVYVDDEVPDGLVGRDALLGYIADSHAEMPGLVVSDTGAPKLLSGRMLVRWVATEGAEQKYSGTDVVEFGSDGRIVRVTNFYEG
jgi:SnoaL-like protein